MMVTMMKATKHSLKASSALAVAPAYLLRTRWASQAVLTGTGAETEAVGRVPPHLLRRPRPMATVAAMVLTIGIMF